MHLQRWETVDYRREQGTDNVIEIEPCSLSAKAVSRFVSTEGESLRLVVCNRFYGRVPWDCFEGHGIVLRITKRLVSWGDFEQLECCTDLDVPAEVGPYPSQQKAWHEGLHINTGHSANRASCEAFPAFWRVRTCCPVADLPAAQPSVAASPGWESSRPDLEKQMSPLPTQTLLEAGKLPAERCRAGTLVCPCLLIVPQECGTTRLQQC